MRICYYVANMSNDPQVENTLALSAQIETLLFYFAKELTQKEIAKMLDASVREVKTALKTMQEEYATRGIRLVTNGKNYSLVTAPEMAIVLAQLTEQEKQKPLSKSALETLSVVCYKAPVTRIEIDFIRGVNSNYALRNLITRGLIEKVQDKTKVQYRPTVEALRFIGVESQEQLPDYENIVAKAAEIISHEQEKEDDASDTDIKNDEE